MAQYSTILGPRGEQIPLNGKAKSRQYRATGSPSWGWDWGWDYSKRPMFNLMIISLMRFDPVVSFGLRVRKAPVLSNLSIVEDKEDDDAFGMPGMPGMPPMPGQGGGKGTVESPGFIVDSDNPKISEFVAQTLHHIGLTAGSKLLAFMDWGFAGFEVTYKEMGGMIQVDQILDFAPWDIRPLVNNREVIGLSVPTMEGNRASSERLRLLGMQSLWLIHERQYTNWFGTSQLRYAYEPWHDKWSEGGAIDVRRLWAHKDVYGGDIIWYPDKIYNYSDGDKHARDVAREQVERRKTGGVMGFPSTVDATSGQREWQYDRPSNFIDGANIMQYPKELDTEILRGLFIPDDLIQSTIDGATGTYGGRKVTVEAFYNVCQQEWNDLLFALDEQIIQSLVTINFGKDATYDLKPRPIQPDDEEQQQQPGMMPGMDTGPEFGGGIGGELPGTSGGIGGSSPTQMGGGGSGRKYISRTPKPGGGYSYTYPSQLSLAEDLVGKGIAGATELVAQVKDQLFNRHAKDEPNAVLMGNTAHAPKGGVTIEGQFFPGGWFIPGHSQAEVDAAAASQGGREEQPARPDQADDIDTSKPDQSEKVPDNAIPMSETQFQDIENPQAILDIISTISEYDPELADFGARTTFKGAKFPEGVKANAIARPKDGIIFLPDGKMPQDPSTIAHELDHLKQYAEGLIPEGGRDAMTPDEFNALEQRSAQAAKRYSNHTHKQRSLASLIPYHKGSLPEHLSKLRIPPGWKNVKVASDPSSYILALGQDKKGRRTAIYSADYKLRKAREKFERVQSLQKDFSAIKRKNTINAKSGSEPAMVLSLIMNTGMRPGSRRDRKAEKQAFGAATLQARHINVGPEGQVTLSYTGKKGIPRTVPIKSPRLKEIFIEKKRSLQDNDEIFNVSARALRNYTRKLTGDRYSPKDMRTRLATSLAAKEVAKKDAPKTEKEYKAMVKAVATKIAVRLGNTAAIALQSYIDPTTFTKWQLPKLEQPKGWSQLSDWTRYQGPRGGTGWRHTQTGQVLYQDEMPGSAKTQPAESVDKQEDIQVSRPDSRNPSFDDEMTFRLGDKAVLKVAKSKYAPTDWSVTETLVDESVRRQGIASRLIDKMKSTLKGTIGAQCSSDGSVRLFWNKGFRIDGTLEEALADRREWSSVNLIYNPKSEQAT